jgi:putative addiction module component (TIGR02574 family)
MIPQEIQALSTSQKLLLVQELWADIAAHPEHLRLSKDQAAELDRRFEAHDADPTAGIPWDQARKDLGMKP